MCSSVTQRHRYATRQVCSSIKNTRAREPSGATHLALFIADVYALVVGHLVMLTVVNKHCRDDLRKKFPANKDTFEHWSKRPLKAPLTGQPTVFVEHSLICASVRKQDTRVTVRVNVRVSSDITRVCGEIRHVRHIERLWRYTYVSPVNHF